MYVVNIFESTICIVLLVDKKTTICIIGPLWSNSNQPEVHTYQMAKIFQENIPHVSSSSHVTSHI